MDTDLFAHKPVMAFEKVATTPVDEEPENWSRQILVELFRSVPQTADYVPRVEMLKVDSEQGFGLGVVIIENSTDSALSVVRANPRIPKVLIPVIIKNHELCPLDLIMTRGGRMLPLNATRLRESLFRPDTFDMITEDHGDTTLYNLFYPPGRSDNDFGAGIGMGIGGGTQGAVTFMQGPGMKLSGFHMLSRVAPTALGPDLDKLAASADPIAAAASPAFLEGLEVLATAEKTATRQAGRMMDTALSIASPDVIQIGYDDGSNRYWVKSASREVFRTPRIHYMNRTEALKTAGADVIRRVDTDGTATISEDTTQSTKIPLGSKWELVEKPGIYKVKTVHGKELTGWVIPGLIDLDGTHVPMAVFTNGAAAMVQNEIVGAHVAAAVDLPMGPAKGVGMFYASGQGGIVATVPLRVSGAEGGMGGGTSYVVESLTGEKSRVRLVPGLKEIVVTKGEFHIPDSAKFLPLNDEAMVPLVDTVGGVDKTASETLDPSITLWGGDDREVSIRFGNLPKLASEVSTRLSPDDAVFVLCIAGASASDAITKVSSAMSGNTTLIRGLHDVGLASDVVNSTRKIASDRSHAVRSLCRDVVKEAASLPDQMSVDAILSLGFINSENVRMYVSSIPYLEKCLSKICELVLGARMGLTEIPEFAAARASRSLDEVIQGLKALALRDVREEDSSV